jgi:NO-binding membrane sensor protein with MHYT domain
VAALEQFAYGWVTPVLAYLFSFLGCFLGLKATGRARMETDNAVKARWVVLAAWAIGGTGIWVMHFLAMIGFEVSGSQVRYDLPTTLASWITAVVVVGIGLFIVGYGRRSPLKIITAGVLTGVGVAAMHYTGMAAMRVDGHAHYDMPLVDASVIIAVVAATVALWFTITVRRNFAVVGASLLMAVAVTGMHYTGMAAIRVQLNPTPSAVQTGVAPFTMLAPIFVFALLVVIALGYGMLNSVSARDAKDLEDLEHRLRSAAQTAPLTRTPTVQRTDQRDFTRRR